MAQPAWNESAKCSCVCALENALGPGLTLRYERHVFVSGDVRAGAGFSVAALRPGETTYWACAPSRWLAGNIGAACFAVLSGDEVAAGARPHGVNQPSTL
jgi:hypothetical protein